MRVICTKNLSKNNGKIRFFAGESYSAEGTTVYAASRAVLLTQQEFKDYFRKA